MTVTSSPAMIAVRFQAEGWHCWPDAPPRRAYLRDLHRHIFQAEVSMPVEHDDRDVEFHDLRDEALGLLTEQGQKGIRIAGLDFGHRSCEMLARHVAETLAARYGRAVRVSVSEDGECGSGVEAAPAA